MLPTILTIVVSAVAGTAVVWGFVKKIWPVLRKFVRLLDDWTGSPERDGKPAQPGVMGRLAQIDDALNTHTRQLDIALHELFPNSGESLRDEVKRTEIQVETLVKFLSQNRG